MDKKSLKLNAVLNMLRTVMGMIFPLITYPYISRVLQVNNLGQINFSYSIVGYFTLIAAFGISTYAVREGTKRRNDKHLFRAFANEMFTINIITTVVSYVIMFGVLLTVNSLHGYLLIIIILSFTIVFTTIGTDWINTVYEDFTYIAIRTIAFQVVAIVLMFIFVHTERDLYRYVWIALFSSAGANVCNFLYCRRYTHVRVVLYPNINKHLKPMTMIFLSNITTIIFVNSGQTMLGLMCGDYNLGLYAIAVKIYSIVKTVFTSILIVAVPRISFIQTNDSEEERIHFCSIIASILILFVLPMAVGLFMISDRAIMIVGGISYMEAEMSLRLLSIALIGAALASFMTYMIIVPGGKEKILLLASTVSAVIIIGLNAFMIPLWQQNGAAVATIVSEFIVFSIEYIAVRPKLEKKMLVKNLQHAVFACIGMLVVNIVVREYVANVILSTTLIVVLSVIAYGGILLLLRNSLVIGIIRKKSTDLR